MKSYYYRSYISLNAIIFFLCKPTVSYYSFPKLCKLFSQIYFRRTLVMNKKTNFSALLLSCILCIILSLNAYAADSPATQFSHNQYDLSSSNTQSFELYDQDNSVYYVNISPIQTNRRMSNGSYKVSLSYPNHWEASFIVQITANSISSVSTPYAKALTGSISNINLKRNSSSYATLTFLYNYLGTYKTTGIKAYINNNSLQCISI